MADKIKIVVDLETTKAVSNTNALDGAMESLDKTLDDTEKSMSGMWKQVALGQLAFSAIENGMRLFKDFMVDSVILAVSAEESHSKFLTTFKTEGDLAVVTAKDLAENYLLTDHASEKLLASTVSMFKGFKQTEIEALALSTRLIKFSGDMASFNTIAGGTAAVTEIIKKAMLGEREGLQVLDIKISELMVKRRLQKDGLDQLTGAQLFAAKANATLNLAMEQSVDAQGDLARTANSTANTIKKLGVEAENIKKTFGDAILEGISPMFKDLARWVKENKEAIKDFARDAGKAIASFAKFVVDAVDALIALKEVILVTGTLFAANFAINKINNIFNAMALGATKSAAAMLTVRMAALGVAGVITGVLIVAIKLLDGHYSDMQKKIREENTKTIGTIHEFNKLLEGSSDATKAIIEKNKERFEERLKQVNDEIDLLDKQGKISEKMLLQQKKIREFGTAKDDQKVRLDFFKKQIDLVKNLTVAEKILLELLGPSVDLSNKANEVMSDKDRIMSIVNKKLKERNTLMTIDGVLSNKTLSDDKKAIKILGLMDKAEKKLIKTKKESEKLKEKELQAFLKSLPGIKDTGDALKKMGEDGLIPGIKGTKELAAEMLELSIAEARAAEEAEQLERKERKLFDTLDDIMSVTMSVIGGLESLGIISGETAEKVGNLAAAGGNLAAGIIAKDPVAIFTGAIETIVAILDFFVDKGVDRAIDRENFWMDINDDMKESLKELAKEIGNTHAATSIMLDELMDGQITLQNATRWFERIHEILSDVDRGALNTADAIREMGDAFSVWIDKAIELGVTGGKAFFDFIDDLKSRGLGIVEVNDFILDSLKSGFEGYKDFLAGDFSDATVDVFETMLAFEKKIADNKLLVDGIKGLESALFGLSNATRLTEKQFDSFEQGARDGFEELIANNFTANEAMMLMQPTLDRLIFLQREHGLTVDDATQKLIDQGLEMDILGKKNPMERTADAMEALVEMFAKAFGFVTETIEDNIDSIGNKFDELARNIGDLDIQDISDTGTGNNSRTPGFARGTGGTFMTPPRRFRVGEEGPEDMEFKNGQMKITPNSQISTGSTNVTVNMYPEKNANANDLMREFIKGYRNNVQNVKEELANAS